MLLVLLFYFCAVTELSSGTTEPSKTFFGFECQISDENGNKTEDVYVPYTFRKGSIFTNQINWIQQQILRDEHVFVFVFVFVFSK